MKRMVWLGLISMCLSIPGFAAPPSADFLFAAQVSPETVGTPRDPGARAAEMQALQEQLVARQVKGVLKGAAVVELTAAERRQIDTPGNGVERRYLVGVAKPVAVQFSTARSGENVIWSAAVSVPGATALRAHLKGVDLPEGAALYVYNLAGQAFGPYTGRGPLGDGELHTNTVFGEQLLLQVQSPAENLRAPRLNVAEVGILGARFAAPRYNSKGAFSLDDMKAITANASNLCSNNANCVVNAACTSSSVVNDAKDAIASILYQSGASFYICTGGLVADSVVTSVIPYFLTAHHCISSSGEASSVETYFDYQTTCSNPNCTQPYNNTGDTVGATIMATNSSSDYSLLRLSSTPVTADGVATYLGWLSTPVANTNNLALYRISHPKGSPQAYTEGVVDTAKPTCRTLARGSFIYSRDTLGATEGGSSGSPVLNGAGQIVGQLYGACGTDLNNVCNAAANGTVDGAFAASFPALAPFLNPGACLSNGSACTTSGQCCSGSCKGKVCR
jgi:V8-like Glu-specific endopeptidase